MNYEEKYWELREAVDRAWDAYCANPHLVTNLEHRKALETFQDFCVEMLDKLMEENSNVLKRLKEI